MVVWGLAQVIEVSSVGSEKRPYGLRHNVKVRDVFERKEKKKTSPPRSPTLKATSLPAKLF